MIERLDKNKTYIIGVSGGCDSMALLDMCRNNKMNIVIAHINYNLREDTSLDYQTVLGYALKYNIPFEYKEFNKKDYNQGNFQTQARIMRYSFFQEVYLKHHAAGLLLAHHQDDVLETIYMHLERKSQCDYLGIQEETIIQGMKVYRPLLNKNKKDLREYCLFHQIIFHDDYTNFQTYFTRDRIRNTILNTYTDKQKEELLKKAESINDKKQKDLKDIQEYLSFYRQNGFISYTSIKRELLSVFLYELLAEYIGKKKISNHLIHEIIHQIDSKPQIKMHLPVNYLFIKEYDNITVRLNRIIKDYSFTFNKDEWYECEFFKLSEQGPLNNGVYLKDEDYPITVRNIRAGDRIKTSGGTKKISRLFINKKIPYYLRKTWPILLNSKNEIILVPGLAKQLDYLYFKPTLFVIK